MSDHHTQLQVQERRAALTPVTDDGWSDAANEAAERTIRGTLLKFADWRWTAGKEATPLKDGTRLVALATAAMWVRWEDGKPIEYRVREPGKRLPYRDELSHLDESEWEEGPNGEPIDPWRNTRLVYLVDPQTVEAFTFSTSSWGGRGAVCDLGDQIARMRKAHPNAVPIIELRSAEMATKYGRKSKPVFKVIGWKATDTEETGPAERQIATRQDDADDFAADSVANTVARDLDDEIPF